jgi:hypothetical protein
VKNENNKIKIIKTYSGLVTTNDTKFIYSVNISHQVIQEKDSFFSFIDRIPKKLVTKGPRKHEDSKDPLLKKPEIDFNEKTALLIHSHNWYHDPVINEVKKQSGKIYVYFSVSEPDMPASALQTPMGIGSYLVVIIPKTKGEFIFKKVENKSK